MSEVPLQSVNPTSFRALSGRLEFMVRHHKSRSISSLCRARAPPGVRSPVAERQRQLRRDGRLPYAALPAQDQNLRARGA
jgi:hypothetical protein